MVSRWHAVLGDSWLHDRQAIRPPDHEILRGDNRVAPEPTLLREQSWGGIQTGNTKAMTYFGIM